MGRKSEKILKQEDEQPLLKDVVYRYLDKLRTTHRRATVAKYEGQFRNYIIPEFGDKHVDEISTHDIISFAYNLLVGSKALSPKTIHEINALMGRIRRFSILHGYEIRYTTDCIELPTKAKKISILTTKDEEKLLSYPKYNFNLTSIGILLSLFSGIRLGELCALKWNDFSLEKRYFHVSRTMQRLPNTGNTDKKASSKTVISYDLAALLIGCQVREKEEIIKRMAVIGILGLPFLQTANIITMNTSDRMGYAYACLPIFVASFLGFD